MTEIKVSQNGNDDTSTNLLQSYIIYTVYSYGTVGYFSDGKYILYHTVAYTHEGVRY